VNPKTLRAHADFHPNGGIFGMVRTTLEQEKQKCRTCKRPETLPHLILAFIPTLMGWIFPFTLNKKRELPFEDIFHANSFIIDLSFFL
jgi:hypothetical protein